MNDTSTIQTLLDKFLDGRTTLEEEARLAEYFRTHDVPAEWEAARRMFAYFDDGMPGTVTAMPRRRRRALTVCLYAVAAAVVLALVMVWPRTEEAGTADRALASASVAAPDTLVRTLPDTVAVQPSRHRPVQKYHRYKYRPAPPKAYYASAAAILADDSLRALSERMADEAMMAMIVRQTAYFDGCVLQQDEYLQGLGEQATLIGDHVAQLAVSDDEETQYDEVY